MSHILTVASGLILAWSIAGGVLLQEPLLLLTALPAALIALCAFLEISQNEILPKAERDSPQRAKAEELTREDAIVEIKQQFHLTDREEEMLRLLTSGLSRNAIAEKLYLSRNTVDTHIRTLYAKVGCRKKDELVQLLERKAGNPAALK